MAANIRLVILYYQIKKRFPTTLLAKNRTFSSKGHFKTSLKNLRGVRLNMTKILRGGVFSDDTNRKLFKNDSDKQIICFSRNLFLIMFEI